MINISHIKREWITLIESFPTETSILEIVVACINKFGEEESNMTFWKLYYINGELITDQWKSIINPTKQRKEVFAELNIELFNLLRKEEYQEILISHLISIIK